MANIPYFMEMVYYAVIILCENSHPECFRRCTRNIFVKISPPYLCVCELWILLSHPIPEVAPGYLNVFADGIRQMRKSFSATHSAGSALAKLCLAMQLRALGRARDPANNTTRRPL